MSTPIAVLYGSETGDSHDFAETLTETLERYHYSVSISSLDDFDLKKLVSIKVLIVICSTTGQGEFPKNSRKFWKFMLKKKLPNDLFNHLYFTTFGLGDSSYPKFNYAIKKLHHRILQLGGVEFSKRAEADQQSTQGIDGFYIEFQKELLKNLTRIFPNQIAPISNDILLKPRNKLTVDMRKPKRLTESNMKSIAINRVGDENLVKGKILINNRITSNDHFQDVRHFNFITEDQLIRYLPGDTVSLYPTNDPVDVQQFLDCQGWQDIADKRVNIEGELSKIDGGLIKNPTLRSLITHHLDLKAIPRRSFFNLLKHFAADDREREKLAEFASYKDPEELYDYANRPRRSILEVIQEFFSVKIPIHYLFDLLPLIKPRLFSISSEPNSNSVDLTIAIVEYKTMLRRTRTGLCTQWIKSLNVNDEILFKVNRNNLKFNLEKPMIMIAPGTGVAPMRSLIKFLVNNFNYDSSKLFLFYGCRYHDKDFLYEKEFKDLVESKSLTLFTSFSIESGGYVQDRLYLESKLISDLLTKNRASIYLCGSSGKMPTQVRMTLEKILQEQLDLTEEDSKKYLLELELANRYLQETW